jgi:hypothetical protein
MLSRTGRIAVLRRRNAELKDSTPRSQTKVSKGRRAKTPSLESVLDRKGLWLKRRKGRTRGINNLDIRLQMGQTYGQPKVSSLGGKRQRVGWSVLYRIEFGGALPHCGVRTWLRIGTQE